MPSISARTIVQPASDMSVTYIVGFVIAGATIFALAIWIGIRLYRKKLAKRRQENLEAAFLSVRGLVREKAQPTGNGLNPPQIPASSDKDNSSPIALPSRAQLRTSPERQKAERQQIVEHHRQSGSFPKPFSFALRPSSLHDPATPERLSVVRSSYAPSSRLSRFSVVSAASSYNDSLASTTPGKFRTIRKIRQVFDPVLLDELLVSLGESLMILQSFDDGWCVVGRESGLLMPQPKSLFGGVRPSRTTTPTTTFSLGMGAGVGTSSGGNVELGVVPAWCFLKPVKGLKAERPVRSSSLGVTVQMDTPNGDRNDYVSWSNF